MKNNIYKLLLSVFLSFAYVFCANAEIVAYRLKMSLKVPRVYDNTRSLGYRKIQTQHITGYFYIDKDIADERGIEEALVFCSMENRTHKINGKKVTYDVYATGGFWHYIGNNRTEKFKKPSIRIDLDCNPSFNVGEDEPDNTLVISLSGNGSSNKSISGKVSGQIGCGCKAYGHISPTRSANLLRVVDIAAISGKFSLKRID